MLTVLASQIRQKPEFPRSRHRAPDRSQRLSTYYESARSCRKNQVNHVGVTNNLTLRDNTEISIDYKPTVGKLRISPFLHSDRPRQHLTLLPPLTQASRLLQPTSSSPPTVFSLVGVLKSRFPGVFWDRFEEAGSDFYCGRFYVYDSREGGGNYSSATVGNRAKCPANFPS